MKTWTASTWIRWISAVVAATALLTAWFLWNGGRSPGEDRCGAAGPRDTFMLLHLQPLPLPTIRCDRMDMEEGGGKNGDDGSLARNAAGPEGREDGHVASVRKPPSKE